MKLACVLLLTASVRAATIEEVLKKFTRYEDGWAYKLVAALEGAPANVVVTTDDGFQLTPLFAAVKAISEEQEGGDLVLRTLLERDDGKSDIAINVAGKAPDGMTLSPIMLAILHALEGKRDALDAVYALLRREDLDLRLAPAGQQLSVLGVALSAYAAGKLSGLAVAYALLEREDLDVNEVTHDEDGSRISPLGVLVGAVATSGGGSAGLEMARSLLARSDVDMHVPETLADGSSITPIKRCRLLLDEMPDKDALAPLVRLMDMLALRGAADDSTWKGEL